MTTTTITSLDVAPFEALLDEERAKIATAIADVTEERDSLLAAAGENAAVESDVSEDGGEGSTLFADLSQLEELLSQLELRLEEVDAALGRIAEGTFGVCERCGGPIGEGRLEAIPGATQCVACKTAPPWARPGLG